MNYKLWIVISIFLIIIFAFFIWNTIISNVETPKYTVIKKDGPIEIRHYEPQLVAQVTVSGAKKDAINQGFRLLADYIFGNNTSSDKISMTAPVQQSSSIKIAMTAPVQQKKDNDQWVVEFILPSQYSLKSIPKPNNTDVILLERVSQKLITIKFSGSSSRKNFNKYQKILDNYVKQNNISVIGEPIDAYYNPPWTLPFLKRNEIHYLIQSGSS